MLCVRCSHPLPPGADRCVRCFALNPQNRAAAPGAVPTPPESSGTTLHFGGQIAIARPEQPAASEAVTDPPDVALEAAWRSRSTPPLPSDPTLLRVGPAQRPRAEPISPAQPPEPQSLLSMTLDEEPPAPLPRKAHKPPAQRTPWASVGPRLIAWGADAAILSACAALLVVVAAEVVGPQRLSPPGFGSADYWLDLVSGPRLPALWGGLFALLAVGYSWLFAAIGGRTPGMMLSGLRLRRLDGQRVSPGAALARAVLSLASAPALFGFALALFDAKGQALHDKLTGTALFADELAP